jgi:phosphatidate cytidylyltransferase
MTAILTESLKKRVIAGLLALPFVIAAILYSETWVFKLAVVLCFSLALWEFFVVVGFSSRDRIFAFTLGLLHLAFILFGSSYTRDWIFLESAALLLAVFIFYCFVPAASMNGMALKIALTFFGVFYVATLGSFVGLLRDRPYGVFWVFALLAMTWLNDTFAYFAGHLFGRHKLAPMISPGKTIEGFLGGFVGSLAAFLSVWYWIKNDLAWTNGLLLVFLVGCLGPLGDLSESLIKRSFGVKDSGNVIPGHGGMLDRVDALLFTAPVVYLFALWA